MQMGVVEAMQGNFWCGELLAQTEYQCLVITNIYVLLMSLCEQDSFTCALLSRGELGGFVIIVISTIVQFFCYFRAHL